MARHHIPLFGIARQYENLREEILDASDKVYSSGQVLEGDNTTEFEAQIAARTNRTYAVTVNIILRIFRSVVFV